MLGINLAHKIVKFVRVCHLFSQSTHEHRPVERHACEL
jgi:hypothetical protein